MISAFQFSTKKQFPTFFFFPSKKGKNTINKFQSTISVMSFPETTDKSTREQYPISANISPLFGKLPTAITKLIKRRDDFSFGCYVLSQQTVTSSLTLNQHHPKVIQPKPQMLAIYIFLNFLGAKFSKIKRNRWHEF